MDKTKIIKDVFSLAKPIVENLGYELVDVTFKEEENEWFLTIVIYK